MHKINLQDLVIKYSGLEPKPKLRCIGRVSHNRYMQGNKLVSQSTFTVLKRKSELSLSDMIIDDPDVDIANLELENHAEGLYEIVVLEPSRGYYSCGDEDWELKLVPYVEEG